MSEFTKKRKYSATIPSILPRMFPGTPIKKYGPSRKDMKRSYVTKEQVARMMQMKTELKHLDTNVAATAISTSGIIYALSDIPQGITDVTRIGDSALPKQLQLRWNIVGADTPSNILRCVVFRWKMNTAADVPTINEIFDSAFSGNYVLAPLTFHDRARYELLMDKVWVSNPNAASTTNTKTGSKSMKMAKKAIEFQAGIVDGQNKIYLLIVSDSSAITHPTFSVYFSLDI